MLTLFDEPLLVSPSRLAKSGVEFSPCCWLRLVSKGSSFFGTPLMIAVNETGCGGMPNSCWGLVFSAPIWTSGPLRMVDRHGPSL